MLRGKAVSQMPFPGKGAGITVFLQDIRIGEHAIQIGNRFFFICVVRIFPDFLIHLILIQITGTYPVLHAVGGRNAACEQAGPGGRADRGCAEEVFETDSPGRQPIQIRGINIGVACTAHGPGTLIIREYKKNIWFFMFHTWKSFLSESSSSRVFTPLSSSAFWNLGMFSSGSTMPVSKAFAYSSTVLVSAAISDSTGALSKVKPL